MITKKSQIPNPQQNLRVAIELEKKKCAEDAVYFFKKYALIQHPIKGKVNFNLYPFQSETLRQLQQFRFNIILKSRQMGISTLTAGYALHCMLFNSDFKVLVIATRQDVARNLLQKVQVMHDNLPAFLRSGIINNNKLSLSFKNGSEIKAVSSSPESARSEALSLLIIDEMAFIEAAEEIWASSQMTLATGGKAILLSTPNGVGGRFHQIWQQAEEGASLPGLDKFNPIKLPWYLHPERDQEWRDLQDVQLGKRLASQETDAEFLSSGHTVIEGDILQWYEKEHIQEPVERRGIGGDLWIWKYPDYTKDYVVTADVARGDGEDYSAFHIFEIESLEQVAEFKGKVDTQMFGNMLCSIATEYNHALLVIDNKNIGWSTVQVALDNNYKNLYYSYKHDPFTDDNIQLRKNYDLRDKKDMVPGFTTTHMIRPVLISKLEMYLREKSPIFHSRRLLNELFVFVWLNGKPQSQKGYNDDLVMAFGMALYVRDTALRLRQQGIDLMKRALTHTHKSVYTPQRIGSGQWEMPVGGSGQKETLKWLL